MLAPLLFRKIRMRSRCLRLVALTLSACCSTVLLAAGPLTWDAAEKEYTARKGETDAPLFFTVKNTSDSQVIINDVTPSCGCTVVSMPEKPWKLAPGAGGRVDLTVNLRGKSGTLIKTLTVDSSFGKEDLTVKVFLPEPVEPGMALADRAQRLRNRAQAVANRQAVFEGTCASCHAAPTSGKSGQELFVAACAICHDTPHRASMVPELAGLPHGNQRDYWQHWVTHGKDNSLMPAFSKAEGGPLSEEQIASLLDYLVSRPESQPLTTVKAQ